MKKSISFILAVSILLSLVFAIGVSTAFKGDVNGDNEVNNKDVVTMFRYVSGSDRLDDESMYDHNGDHTVDNKDVVSLFRFVSSGAAPEEITGETEPEETEPEEPEDPNVTPDEYFEFSLLSDKTYEIMAKNTNKLPKDVVIPRKHDGKPVTSICDYAFDGCSGLTSVTIPGGVTSIGDWAFSDCWSLTDMTYRGTYSQWQSISKGDSWNSGTEYTLHCDDGDYSRDGHKL